MLLFLANVGVISFPNHFDVEAFVSFGASFTLYGQRFALGTKPFITTSTVSSRLEPTHSFDTATDRIPKDIGE